MSELYIPNGTVKTDSRENTPTKISAAAKDYIVQVIMNALAEEFGENSVGMMRIGTGTSKKNVIGVITGFVESDADGTNPIVFEVGTTAKKFISGETKKSGKYEPFDFYAACAEYEKYITEKEAKEADAAAKKAAKIAKDTAARQAKAEAKAE